VFEQGGFDCALGNPPWEQLQFDPQEFFMSRSHEISSANNMSSRNKKIEALKTEKASLYFEYLETKHDIDSSQKFIHDSARFPLTSFGRINLAPLFCELNKDLISETGRVGVITPTGIATDSFNQYFFGHLVKSKKLVSLYDFENRENIFPGVGHGRYKFCILTLSKNVIETPEFSFFLTKPSQVGDIKRTFPLTAEDIKLLNPNTSTCPVFRTRPDAEITKKVYRCVPILENEETGENPWQTKFMLMFMMNTDSHLFETEYGDDLLPLYEAKMFWHFDHRYGDYADYPEGALTTSLPDIPDNKLADPSYVVTPRYWVSKTEVESRLDGKWEKQWFLAFRDICRSTDERTAVFSLLPKAAMGNNAPSLLIGDKYTKLVGCFLANCCCLTFDYVTRHKVGGTHMNFFIVKQLPVLPPTRYSRADIDFITPRVLELTYTAWDLQPFAQDMGYHGDPFIWNPERRAHLRAELDAYYAHLYGLTRDELRYILDPADIHGPDFPSETFRVLKNNEIKQFGEYRTQRLVLAAWDQLFGEK
jgi:hypothetical protein